MNLIHDERELVEAQQERLAAMRDGVMIFRELAELS